MNLFRYKQFTIDQSHAAMKVGTDSDLLGTLSEGGRKILDIGTGTGVLSLMLAQRCPEAKITAIEIDENAIVDARTNFSASPLGERITLHHSAFQDFVKTCEERYDSILCNPPYFDQSLECDNLSKTRARHTSSLPFEELIGGAYDLLEDEGVFSVCIPPEVLEKFCEFCRSVGFGLKTFYKVKALPDRPPKRYVLVHQKGGASTTQEIECCMRNADHSRSEWYHETLKDFLTGKG